MADHARTDVFIDDIVRFVCACITQRSPHGHLHDFCKAFQQSPSATIATFKDVCRKIKPRPLTVHRVTDELGSRKVKQTLECCPGTMMHTLHGRYRSFLTYLKNRIKVALRGVPFAGGDARHASDANSLTWMVQEWQEASHEFTHTSQSAAAAAARTCASSYVRCKTHPRRLCTPAAAAASHAAKVAAAAMRDSVAACKRAILTDTKENQRIMRTVDWRSVSMVAFPDNDDGMKDALQDIAKVEVMLRDRDVQAIKLAVCLTWKYFDPTAKEGVFTLQKALENPSVVPTGMAACVAGGLCSLVATPLAGAVLCSALLGVLYEARRNEELVGPWYEDPEQLNKPWCFSCMVAMHRMKTDIVCSRCGTPIHKRSYTPITYDQTD